MRENIQRLSGRTSKPTVLSASTPSREFVKVCHLSALSERDGSNVLAVSNSGTSSAFGCNRVSDLSAWVLRRKSFTPDGLLQFELGQKFVVAPSRTSVTTSSQPIAHFRCTVSACKDWDDNVVLSMPLEDVLVVTQTMGAGSSSHRPNIIDTDLQRQLMCGSGSFREGFTLDCLW